jgi:hypothetical protein
VCGEDEGWIQVQAEGEQWPLLPAAREVNLPCTG